MTRTLPPAAGALLAVACTLAACAPAARTTDAAPSAPAAAAVPAPVGLPRPMAMEAGERHLTNVRQLTDGGENAEAYFSADGRRLIFQSTRDGRTCDQQYVMNVDGSGLRRVSNGQGKTTCGYFYEEDRRVFFASTHAADSACPARPDPSQGYVWGIDPFDIYTANPDGSDLRRLTNYGTYTAEGVLSPDGRTIVFTSLKDGDLDIYTMNVDGTNVRRLTSTPGYDGGPWWSPDGTKIVWRAHHPTDSAELAAYRRLLDRRMIRPNRMELFVMNADGSDQHTIVSGPTDDFGSAWSPDGDQIAFIRFDDRTVRVANADGSDVHIVRAFGLQAVPGWQPKGDRQP